MGAPGAASKTCLVGPRRPVGRVGQLPLVLGPVQHHGPDLLRLHDDLEAAVPQLYGLGLDAAGIVAAAQRGAGSQEAVQGCRESEAGQGCRESEAGQGCRESEAGQGCRESEAGQGCRESEAGQARAGVGACPRRTSRERLHAFSPPVAGRGCPEPGLAAHCRPQRPPLLARLAAPHRSWRPAAADQRAPGSLAAR